jgi:hypothetical protein
LGLLGLAPEVMKTVLRLGDPLASPVVTERSLRPPLKLPAEEQVSALMNMVPLQRNEIKIIRCGSSSSDESLA